MGVWMAVKGVPGGSGGAFRVDPNTAVRWAASDPAVASTLKLPFKDAAGNAIGALDVDAVIAGTNFNVNDRSDGTGFNYTTSGRIGVSWAVTASGIEITFSNDALGALYILDLAVTGIGLSPFSTDTVTREDAGSIGQYGSLPDEYLLDLPVVGDYPSLLAAYLLEKQKAPRLLFDGAVYDSPGTAGTAHLFALDLLDLVEIWDDQAELSCDNLITNGDFADGETGWSFGGGAVHSASGGKLHLYRNGGGYGSAYQDFAYAVATGDTFSVSFKVANPSAADKEIKISMHEIGSGVGAMEQVYIIAAGAAEATRTFSTVATLAWSSFRFEIYIETDDNLADLTFDDIRVTRAAVKCLITGAGYKFAAGEISEVTLHTRPVPAWTYWQLGHSTFGKLGTSTRLAL